MRSLQRNKKGMSAWSVIGIAMVVVVGVVFLSILLPVGLGLNLNIVTAVGPATGWSTAANTTFATIQTNIQGGFNLLAISPTVLAAGGIISILVAAFAVALSREGGF